MHITDIICSAGKTGFYFDDQKAIKTGVPHDGFFCGGKPLTSGFHSVRQAGESISVMLLLEDGQVAYGDCAAVQYSGAGGRDPVFLANEFIPLILKKAAPLLKNRPLKEFRPLAAEADSLENKGRQIHTAIRYGLTQAILDAVAKATRRLPCEVIADEYGTSLANKPIRIFTQSGDDRYVNADKMIIKQADVLPHGLINHVPDKLGRKGEKLPAYVKWLRKRILAKRADARYQPDLHLDVYGTIGQLCGNDTEKMGRYLARLGKAAFPLKLRIEGPMDMGEQIAQCEALAALRKFLRQNKIHVGIVADEWCNTLEDTRLFADRKAGDMIQIKTPDLGGIQNSIEAVLYCKQKGVGAYLGGTCNETDRSAQMCVHIALATQPDQMLSKPGMGVDEGYMIVYNEMRRTLALLAAKKRKFKSRLNRACPTLEKKPV
ncbi:MAG: methylaspartate ammonia-lyase [Verrucomicrobiae bacterium]|nr:methylaspartate ammonia-lyase [Verrucomicrobiae bacterium]